VVLQQVQQVRRSLALHEVQQVRRALVLQQVLVDQVVQDNNSDIWVCYN
jgi:hypothetical protein